ncbi:type 1 fimbrial protein [Salmonella enterica]|nr:type 1 fimbrial protein [Salmonella enterica]
MKKSKMVLAGMIAVGVALTTTSALADVQGTQTFTANISETTCLISGVDQSVSLSPINKTDSALATGKEYYKFPLKIEGCSNALTSVEMTPTFEQIDGAREWGYAKNKGTAVVDAVWGVRGNSLVNENVAHPEFLQSGMKVTAPLTAGTADISVFFRMNASGNNSSLVKPGTLNYPLLLTFDFK